MKYDKHVKGHLTLEGNNLLISFWPKRAFGITQGLEFHPYFQSPIKYLLYLSVSCTCICTYLYQVPLKV
jgi:hypothetical protein